MGINHVPNYVAASSVKGLRRLMLINNKKHNGFVKYFDIQYVEKDGKWYAWYFVTEGLKELMETLGEDS